MIKFVKCDRNPYYNAQPTFTQKVDGENRQTFVASFNTMAWTYPESFVEKYWKTAEKSGRKVFDQKIVQVLSFLCATA